MLPLAAHSASQPARFSGSAALSYTAKAVSFGERPSGSDAIVKLRAWIVAQLKPLGPTVVLDSFTGHTPAGLVPMANIIAKFPGSSGKAIAVTGHYDTKRIPMVHFVGANDAGSSTGFLLELAHVLARQKHTDDIYLVWFDGEEAVRAEWSEADSRYGSRHLADKWMADGTLSKLKALINIDMVGDKNLDIAPDLNSSQSLRDLIWRTAESLGYGKYFPSQGGAIDDDHMPFIASGAHAVDIIDLDYGPQNSYWHTAQDTMDKLSAHSFQVVGDVIVQVLAKLQAQ
ncbi:MAG TPA: M28 family peptidase [Bryobacteraceae bacterium]|nr:M28 family peptidase [Bryobacteraceae bacterium]